MAGLPMYVLRDVVSSNTYATHSPPASLAPMRQHPLPSWLQAETIQTALTAGWVVDWKSLSDVNVILKSGPTASMLAAVRSAPGSFWVGFCLLPSRTSPVGSLTVADLATETLADLATGTLADFAPAGGVLPAWSEMLHPATQAEQTQAVRISKQIRADGLMKPHNRE